MGYILTRSTVTTSSRTHQHTVTIQQIDRKTINLQLRKPLRCGTGEKTGIFLGLCEPCPKLLKRKNILKGVHAYQMGYRRKSLADFSTYLLGRRIVSNQRGILCLNLLKPAVEPIIFGIRESRGIFLIVVMPGGANSIGQLGIFSANSIGQLSARI